MRPDLRPIFEEYCESLQMVRRARRRATRRVDQELLGGMEADLSWAMEYMATGYIPENLYPRRTIPVDPIRALACFSSFSSLAPSLPSERVRLQVLQALEILTPQERECYLMVVGEGLSYSEVAEMMRLRRGTVQKYVERARKKLLALRLSRDDDKSHDACLTEWYIE